MSALVMKFGGTSVGSNQALRQVLSIVQREVARVGEVVVVSSAMGGLTDFLVQLVTSATAGDREAIQEHLQAIRQRHHEVMDAWFGDENQRDEWELVNEQLELLLAELDASCESIIVAGKANAQLRDAVLSMGERLMVRVLAAILRANQIPAQYVDASDILVTNERHQNAQPIFEPSLTNAQKILLPLLEKHIVPVVTGYIGATPAGAITTLGRGGSDYSATYLASLIDASDTWIWTDVDGVMSGDPRKLKNAQIINTISYQAISEFAHFGAKVLHPRAVEPLIAPKIPLRVCNTFNADFAGTRINGLNGDKPKQLSAVTDSKGVLVFAPTISPDQQRDDMPSIQEIAEQILVDNVYQAMSPVITVDSHTGRLLCYLVPTTARKTASDESVEQITESLTLLYPEADWRVEPVSIVAAIGVVDVQQTMQVLSAVRSVKADLLAMGQGSPECALLVVPPQHASRVIKRLHNIAVASHHRLNAAAAAGMCPPVPEIPASRKRRTTRERPGRRPPPRSIPL